MWFLLAIALVSGDDGTQHKAMIHPYETQADCEQARQGLIKEMADVKNKVFQFGSVCTKVDMGQLT